MSTELRGEARSRIIRIEFISIYIVFKAIGLYVIPMGWLLNFWHEQFDPSFRIKL